MTLGTALKQMLHRKLKVDFMLSQETEVKLEVSLAHLR